MPRLDLHISERARLHIAEMLRAQEDDSLPALFFGSSRQHRQDGVFVKQTLPHWSLSVYSKSQAERLDRDYVAGGSRVIQFADDVALCVPQQHLVAELQGKTLDLDGRTVCVR